MDSFLIYLLKVSAVMSLLYIAYLSLFRKDTFYLRNRVILLFIIILPLILPFIRISFLESATVEDARTIITTVIPSGIPASPAADLSSSPGYADLIFAFYLAVASVLLLRLILSVASTFVIIRSGEVVKKHFPKVVISQRDHPPFSFFPYAVIPEKIQESEDYKCILDHEISHIRQGHTFDLLLGELFIAFQWFNPLAWFLKRSLELNHEFSADSFSVSEGRSIKAYQYSILRHKTSGNVSFAHNFSSLIKNRLIMINRKPTTSLARVKILFIIPVLALILFAFARPGDGGTDFPYVPGDVKGIIKQADGSILPGAVIVVKGTTTGTKSDEKGQFALKNIGEDATLVISFVGFKTQEVRAAFGSEMVIKMETQLINIGKVSITPKAGENEMVVVEELPSFPGGESAMRGWIAANLEYPAEAVSRKVEGTVLVEFTVSSAGKVKDVKVSKPVNPLLDAAAVKVIGEMPAWTPGKQNGKAVSVGHQVAVMFKLK